MQTQKTQGLAGQLVAMEEGRISARDLAEFSISQAENRASLNALVWFDPDRLRQAADQADKRRAAGHARPLEGIALAIKDNVNTRDIPTTAATSALSRHIPARTAEALELLCDAGAIVGAKTNMHEIAFGITSNNVVTGAVGNPWDAGMIAGGSSGGTAAAVAAGIFLAGLGTDTGGSVRIPSALCGVAGFRPSVGRYPAKGVVPVSATRDTIGPIATQVEDLILLDGFMNGGKPVPTSDLAPSDLRLGVPRSVLWSDLDPGVSAACEAALDVFRQVGVTLVELDLPDFWHHLEAASFTIVMFEALRDLPGYLSEQDCGIDMDGLVAGIGSPDVRQIYMGLLADQAVPQARYDAAMRVHRPIVLDGYTDYIRDNRLDAVIQPTTALTARPIGQDETITLNGAEQPTFSAYIRNTDHGSLIGAPGISLPVGLSDGLPVGLEIDGLPGEDAKLLDTARVLERLLQPLPQLPELPT